MGISLKRLAVACALALASATAMAQTVEVPTTIPETIPDGSTAAGGGLVLTLFSTSSGTPYSYSYYLGVNSSQVSLLTSDMASDGKSLTWSLPSLVPAGATGDLRWHVTSGYNTGGSGPGANNFLTTINAESSMILGPVRGCSGAGNPTGYLQNGAVTTAMTNRFAPYALNLTSNAGNADISTNPADPFFQGASTLYGPSISGGVQNAGLIGQALEFYLLSTADNPALAGQQVTASGAAVATRYQSTTGSIGHWLLNLENDTLSWSVAPVPLPAAAWLLLSGLAGLGVISRRRAAV